MSEHRFTQLGRYEVTRVLGQGAMGDVYLAEDPVIGRKVAIKVVQKHPALSDEELHALHKRFEQEFRLAGSLSHPNIVTIHDVGQERGCTFVAMEFIRGETLQEILASERIMSFKEVGDIGMQIADALDYAHERGVIHRDVKPANIMMTHEGRPKLTDFGIAKVGGSNMTQTGMIIGTPAYMSPEQITGHPVTPQSDQFAFAAILFEVLTGQQPFRADNPTTVMFKIVHEPPPDPLELNPDLPEAVAEVLLRGLAKTPEERYSSCTEMVRALSNVLGAAKPDATLIPRPGRPAKAPASTGADNQATVLATGEDATIQSGAVLPPSGAAKGPDKKTLYAIGGLVAVVLVGALWYFAGSGETSRPETIAPPAGRSPAAGDEAAGTDSGATPAEQPEGAAGEPAAAEGTTQQAANATPDGSTSTTQEEAAPATEPEPQPVQLTVTSAPAGARILVDGTDTGAVTPAPLLLAEGEEKSVRLELDGYEPAGWTFSLATLSDEQRSSGTVHFPLTPSTPPGHVVLNAAYPVSIAVSGRTYGPTAAHDISLRPGDYDVRLRAPEVFLDTTQRVKVDSEGTVTLSVPEVVTIDVLAQPSNCKIHIDGREVDFAPLNGLEITVGRHTFLFDWPAPLNKKQEQVEIIRRDGQRVFGRSG